jgi:hypothetical protein
MAARARRTAARLPLRLTFPPSSAGAAVDGAWWPRDTIPHRVLVARGLLHVGSFPRTDNHQVWLKMSTRTLIRLSVQEPEGAAAVSA